MKTINYIKILIIIFLVVSYSNNLAQISVVVSKSSNQKLNESELKEAFTGFRLTWPDGNKVQVIDQAESDTKNKFYSSFLDKSVNQVRMQWTKLVLSGQASAPTQAENESDVKKKVSSNINAVGYISSKSLDDTVKEIYRIE